MQYVIFNHTRFARRFLLLIGIVAAGGVFAASPRFEKLVLNDEYYCDGIDAGDIDRDGNMDVVAGPFWYAGPDFKTRHAFYPAVALPPAESPSNSMFSFVYDFSGDDWPDILVLGRVHKHAAYWYENPGATDQPWKKHFVFERVRGESPTLVDLNGDGQPQLICHWQGRWGWIEPHPQQPRRPWRFMAIGADEQWPQFYHGTGVGDVDGDGRQDIVLNDGWYRQPADAKQPWDFQRMKFSQQRGGAQMFVDDVDGDGKNDVITAIDAHGWGLAWFQRLERKSAAMFQEHTIMGDRSQEATYGVAFTQPHALQMADIDGDGDMDIVTGKRRWAHGPTGDIEPSAPPVVYWFEHHRNERGEVQYLPHQIDDDSGVGVQIAVKDVSGDGRPDVLTASKLGTFVFINRE